MSSETKKGIDLDELQSEIERALTLLKDRHPGLSSWNELLSDRLKNIREQINQAL